MFLLTKFIFSDIIKIEKIMTGVEMMKVEINISPDAKEPLAVIYTDSVTDEIQKAVEVLQQQEDVITVSDDNGRIIVLQSDEIFMARTEQSKLTIYCKNKKFYSKKHLYEFAAILGKEFIQISKSAFVNLKQIDSVEPSFSGLMNLKLKNGLTEYISRKYLPNFKKYLGI